MSFGFGATGFGAASSPFGTTSPSPFGQQAPAFGQTAASPFGGGATATPGAFGQSTFGAAPAPAFGASPAPAFGAASTPAFGAAPTSAFGAKPAFGGFGASAASPFGAASAPAFGASTPAFGAASAPAFGAAPSPFGAAPSFGAASAPAFGAAASSPVFGAASTPAFGAPLTAFGSAAGGAFGAGGFGGGARGTRAVAWRKTQEQDTSGNSGAKTTVFFNSISCMPEYAGKSADELRWEDYADGCKGNTNAPSPGGGAFGAAPAFGAAAASPFGATSAPAFGAAASSPGFGGFGAASAPAFGAFGATSAPAFGAATSAPAFGGFGATAAAPFGASPAPAAASPFGAAPAFGATSAPAFGATSAPAFGAASTPAFGASSQPSFGFGASPAPAFGASPAPAFGAASSPAFGGFGATSAPAFGATSAPAFGASPAPAFGFASSAPAFGAASAPAFGAASSASLFGAASTPAFGGTSLFGNTQQTSAPAFGFGAASTPAFGASPAPAFGASSSSLFGAASTPAFGGGGLFGSSGAAPSFSFAPSPAAAPAGGALVPAQAAQPPGVATSPYGALPEPPKVSPAPEYKVGLTQRPAGLLSSGPPRPAALITPRSLTPRSGVRMRPRHGMSASRASKSPGDFLAAAAASATPGTDGRGATPNGAAFVPRENPRRLFVRDPLPSTEAAATSSASPALGGTPGVLRTPGSGLRLTPGRRGGGGDGDGGADADGGFTLAENGFGPHGGTDGQLSDAQVAALLPTLTQPEYYTEPSLQQLAAMARDDPDSLAAISGFTVGRRGVGSVRWLEPTDVRRLDLDATVRLDKGSIEVYLDESAKPEVGRGLNKAAEVTMLRVHRMDKATGKPTADPEAIDRFTRKLKKMSAEQGARFVSYEPGPGTWRFEVEHFSRYGLVDSDDEDSSGGEEAPLGVRRAGSRQAQHAAASSQGRRRGGAERREEEEEDELEGEGVLVVLDDEDGDGGDAMLDSQGLGGSPSASGGSVGGGQEEDMGDAEGQELSLGGGAAAGRALQVSLPAQLGMDPEDLQRIRDGLYASQRQPPKQRSVVLAARGPEGDAAAAPTRQQRPAAQPAAAGPAHLPLARRNSWRKQQPAPVWQPTGSASAPRTPPPAGPPLLPAGPTPVSGGAAAPSRCAVPAPDRSTAAPPGRERCLPDAGLFGGAAFRAGWAPNAVLAHAGGRASSASHLVIRQPTVGARVAPPGADTGPGSAFRLRQRRVLEAALRLHLQHSSPDAEPADGGAGSSGDEHMSDGGGEAEGEAEPAGVPRWRLRCGLGEQLAALTRRYAELCGEAAAEAEGLEREVLRHQASTWRLLHVLFCAIEGEAARAEPGGGDDGGDGEPALHRLAAFKRRAQVSHWLRDAAAPEAEAGVRAAAAAAAGAGAASSDAAARQLLALLSGHQLGAAAALAAATGNVRLATLLAGAGLRAEARDELAAQLRVWAETGCEPHVGEALRRVYRLLAGQVDEVTPEMGLDWRRALGLRLWYGCPPTATVSDALAAYADAVEAGAAPPPLPRYAERGAAASAGASDVAFELLRLHAVAAADPGVPAAAHELQPLLARLLRPACLTPDPLDHGCLWHLLSALEALGVLPPAAAALPEAAVVRMGFISQLEAAGLPHWAVYAALHIPQADERARVVRELLRAHADVWCDDAEAAAFLRGMLRLPPGWLAGAQALWARYRADDAARLGRLLAGGDWAGAHALLCAAVAPRWLLGGAGGAGALTQALAALEPHAADINAAGGAGAWEAGGGAYAAFLYLRDEVYAPPGGGGSAPAEAPPLSFRERLEAAGRLAAMLGDGAARWGLAGGGAAQRRLDAEPGGGAPQQAVYAYMAAELSKWVLSDGEDGALLPLPEQDRLAVGIRAMPYQATAEAVQMAAVHLAQRVA